MKRLLATAAIALTVGAATTAHAGGSAPQPTMPPVVIADDTSASSHDILVPILALIFVVTVLHH